MQNCVELDGTNVYLRNNASFDRSRVRLLLVFFMYTNIGIISCDVDVELILLRSPNGTKYVSI